jgi:hypothetical protein
MMKEEVREDTRHKGQGSRHKGKKELVVNDEENEIKSTPLKECFCYIKLFALLALCAGLFKVLFFYPFIYLDGFELERELLCTHRCLHVHYQGIGHQ